MPDPPRRTSVRVADALVDVPSSPPPAPTSPRPVTRRPETPQIITTLVIQEQEQEALEEDNKGARVILAYGVPVSDLAIA